jgi:mRNA interferase MazF
VSANPKYKQGDIYLVKFHPSLGKELRKYRPAVVVFDSVNNGFVTIAPLTSNLNIKHSDHEFVINSSKNNGLKQSSLVLAWYLRTIDDQAMQKLLGRLSKSNLTKLKKSLTKLFS